MCRDARLHLTALLKKGCSGGGKRERWRRLMSTGRSEGKKVGWRGVKEGERGSLQTHHMLHENETHTHTHTHSCDASAT